MKCFRLFLQFVVLLVLLNGVLFSPSTSAEGSGVIRHVTPNGSESGDCSNNSWENPCTMQHALSVAQAGDEIWVKGGTYLPTKDGDKEVSFILKNGVAIYGGFSGNEITRDERLWSSNVSTLSGDLLGNDSGVPAWDNPAYTDNSYHVVTADGVNNTSVLDGFIIRGGFAAGGEYGDDPLSGGGISMYRSSPVLINLTIAGNAAAIANGGGLLIAMDSDPLISNVLFSGNIARLQGGAMHILNSTPVLTNVTMTGNQASQSGSAISLYYGSVMVRNSIIWGNVDTSNQPVMIMNPGDLPIITFTDIEGGCPTNVACDNTDREDDPKFIDAIGWDCLYGTMDDNPRLQESSPLINLGSNQVMTPSLTETDLDGLPRITQNTVDMGAFEWIPSTLILNQTTGGTISVGPSEGYHYGDTIYLTVSADPGYNFLGWTGDCSTATGMTCAFFLLGDKTVSANFEQNVFSLTIIQSAGGVITADPEGPYHLNDMVTLTATTDPGYTFDAWSGDCFEQANPCALTMDSDKSISASFTQEEYALTITQVEGGTINASPSGPYHLDDAVTITATSDDGWGFGSWTGDCSGESNPCHLTMIDPKSVSASFTQNEYALIITQVTGGTITTDPEGPYHLNDVVTVTATPDSDFNFDSWIGDCAGQPQPCTLSMDAAKSVSARFVNQIPVTLTIIQASGGTITADPAGPYTQGQWVTLTANADLSYKFFGWNGDFSGTTNPASLLLDNNKVVSAIFGTHVLYLPSILR